MPGTKLPLPLLLVDLELSSTWLIPSILEVEEQRAEKQIALIFFPIRNNFLSTAEKELQLSNNSESLTPLLQLLH